MEIAGKVALFACGAFFFVGLLTGVWKYLCIRQAATAQAPRYVNVAHSASLQYAFATLVLLKLLEFSPYGRTMNLIAVSVPVFFFAIATLLYILHAALQDTDNQFRRPYALGKWTIQPFVFHSFVWLLIVGEVGGFTVLLVGALRTLFR